MRFPKSNLKLVYEYIKTHDGQTILVKDIAEDTWQSQWTVSRALKWLEERNIIVREGKKMRLNYQ